MPKKLNFPAVYIKEVSSKRHTISGVATSITGFIGGALSGPVNQAVRILSFGDYERAFGGLSYESPMSYAVRHYFLNGGREAYVVRVTKRSRGNRNVGEAIEFKEIRFGLKAFDKVELINLLCIPPFSFQDDVDAQTWKFAAEYCASRRTFLIVDPPSCWEKQYDLYGILEDRNAALYFPRLIAMDPLSGNSSGVFAPCGAVAGCIAKHDTDRGVWNAPAGPDATLVGFVGISAPLSDTDGEELNRRGINCIRYVSPNGIVIMGARTLQGADQLTSEWKYVNMRRLALFIEESLYRGLQWAVFEPNGEPLWSQIRMTVGAFLQTLFREGAFQGSTEEKAYFVKCDQAINTQRDIDSGVINILVGFAPLKPAEFLLIKMQLKS